MSGAKGVSEIVKGRKRWIAVGAGAAAAAVLAVLLWVIPGSSVRIPEGALKDVYCPEAAPVYTGEEIQEEALTAVGANDQLELLYDPAAVAVQIRDKHNDFIWSSAFDPSAYAYEADEALARGLATLFQIVYTDAEGITSTVRSHDEGVNIRAEKLENGVSLHASFPDIAMAMTVEIWLDGEGLNARIPQDGLEETGGYRLVSADLLTMLGAADNSEEGYMVYPDGSGMIYRYKESVSDIPKQIHKDIYSPVLLDYADVTSSVAQGHKNISLPAFGVVKGQNALVGYVSQGDDNGYIQLLPSGYGYLVNSLNAGITYRKTYSFQTPDGSEEFAIEQERRTGDLQVKYFFLQGEDADYSGMAGAIRRYLKSSGRLSASPLLEEETAPVYTEILVEAREQTMLWENEVVMTDFKTCRSIMEDLQTENVRLIASLLGWQKEGYGQYPAHSAPSGSVGGAKGLEELNRFSSENGIHLLLSENFTRGFEGVGGFSKNKESVYSADGLPVADKLGEEYFLNAYSQLTKLTQQLLPKYKDWGSGLALEELGRFLYDDYSKTGNMTRMDTMAAYVQITEAVKEQMGIAAVQNGNAYLLSCADFLFNVADSGSGDPLLDEAIPFYQLVVHGSIPYCSHIAANMSCDERAQQLRWAEYGSVPYYLVTGGDPVKLKDSYVTTVFSSRYEGLKESMHKAVEEYSRKMDGLWNQEIREHISVDDMLKKVVYADNSRVYVNYDTVPREVDGVTVAPQDYTVCLPDGTQR